MKKRITLLLTILLCICILFGVGCSSYRQAPADDGGKESSSSGELSQGEGFSVTLRTTDGGALPSLDGIYAQWTEVNGANVYRAPFDKKGVALSEKPDGEYRVTLSATPAGYTYDPNIYFSNNESKDRVIELYPLRECTGSDGSSPAAYAIVGATGAYRFTFEKPSQVYYFVFGVPYSALLSFQSLLDVTQNEVLPIFYNAGTIFYYDVQTPIIGGGAENSYTKNFYYERDLTDSQDALFKIGLETVNEKAFPVTIDVLIQKAGEYTESGANLEIVEPPSTLVDYSGETPTGTFSFIGVSNGFVLDESKVVYDEREDRFYLKDGNGQEDRTKMLYVMLKKDIPNILSTPTTQNNRGLSYAEIRHSAYHVGKEYSKFINGYFPKTNTDGSYPATAALKEYLYNFSIARQYFYDGKGSAETLGGYTSDEKSQWLFACGYYE